MAFLHVRNTLFVVVGASISLMGDFAPPVGAKSASGEMVNVRMAALSPASEASRSTSSVAFVSPANLYRSETPDPKLYSWVLADKMDRVAPELRAPSEIQNRVQFWLRVYTEWSTQQVVIFDSYHPELVYEVLDFRDLAATARNAMAYEIMRDRRIERTLKAYKTAFANLGKKQSKKRGKKARVATREEQIILDTVAHLGHKHQFRELGRHVRTQTGQRDNVIRALVAARPFMQKMEEIFAEYEIPAQVTRLSLVESSFTIGAVSKSGAAGVWQFMPASAREYMTMSPGEKNRTAIDERLSPIKSTVAAAQLLRRSYKNFKSWPLAITSYHHGTTGIKSRRGRDNSQFKSIAHLFSTCGRNSKGLGWASQNYYAEFLAMTYAEAYRDRFYGEQPDTQDHSIQFVSIKAAKAATKVAAELKVPLVQFQELNPDILDLRAPLPKGFRVAIPGSRSTAEDVAILAKKKPAKKRAS